VSFLRVGDTFAYDPRTLRPLEYEWADERSVDEIAGFSVRLASQSGAHEHADTDRRVTRSMTLQLAGMNRDRMDRIMGCLVDAGVWSDDGTGWKLENDTGYLHLLTQDEKDRQRARGADERNPALTVPAKLRDGDSCRFCGLPVNWADRKSIRGGTWEHLDITVQPTTLDLFVVCCFGCNRNPVDRAPLRPSPDKPKYGNATRKFVRDHLGEFPTAARIAQMYPGLRPSSGNAAVHLRTDSEDAVSDQRTEPVDAVDDQRSDAENAASGTVQQPTATAKDVAEARGPNGSFEAHSASSEATFAGSVSSRTDRGSHGSGSAGSGRDGSGLPWSPLDSPGPATGKAPSKRSRRGPARGGRDG